MNRGKLKAARKAKGLTQAAMAEYLDIDIRYYQKLERGDSNGSFGIWDALEDLLGVHQRILREISSTRPGQEESQ